MRLMCVDDDPHLRMLLEMALSEFDVRLCASGEEALEQCAADAPDLVLLDMMMPGMSGVETLRALRADARTASVPVAFITGKAAALDVDFYKREGAIAVIEKPIDLLTLPGRVQALLSGLKS